MLGGVERKRTLHMEIGGYFGETCCRNVGIRSRVGGQNRRLPVEFRKVLRKAQGALNAAADIHRRKVIGDHQNTLHHVRTPVMARPPCSALSPVRGPPPLMSYRSFHLPEKSLECKQEPWLLK